jgi:hypothetical protein
MIPVGWDQTNYKKFWQYLYVDQVPSVYIWDEKITAKERAAFFKLSGYDRLSIANALLNDADPNLKFEENTYRWTFSDDAKTVIISLRMVVGFEDGTLSDKLMRQQVLFPAVCGWAALIMGKVKKVGEARDVAIKFCNMCYGTAALPDGSIPPEPIKNPFD